MHIKETHEYFLISRFYGEETTKRSGVKLINHIDEGLAIMEKIGASEIAMRAYCVHPIFQGDDAVLSAFDLMEHYAGISARVLLLAMEYRNIANQYLSYRTIRTLEDINLSQISEVNDMLIADKVQNRKDFELYHKGTHQRSAELDRYFKNWLRRLDISEERYRELIEMK